MAVRHIPDREALLVIADNIEGFWGGIAAGESEDPATLLKEPDILRLLKEDAAKLREIANAR
jgi:hypothetical protein